MSLFDFLKPKSDPLSKVMKDPEIRRLALLKRTEILEAKVSSLRAVGRSDEALSLIKAHLEEMIGEMSHVEDAADWLVKIANASIKLGSGAAKPALKVFLEANEKGPASFDPTTVYYNLGRLCHQLRDDPDEELWCYHMATQSIAPVGCKYPATVKDKALAHWFAYMCAKRIGNQEHVDYHDLKRHELVPELDWNDPAAITKWMAR